MESDIFEKRFINFDGIKGSIPKKSLWFNKRVVESNVTDYAESICKADVCEVFRCWRKSEK